LRESDAQSLLRPVPVAEELFVLLRSASQQVMKDARAFLFLTREEDAAMVVLKDDALIAGAWQDVRQLLARVDVQKLDRQLVFSSLPGAVGDQVPIFGDVQERNRSRVIRAQGMRIEQDLVLSVAAFADVENGQILIGQALGEEVTASMLLGNADRVDLQELRDAPLDRVAPRKGAQERLRVLVLLVDPRARLGRLLVLEPAVGVRDRRGAVRVLDLFGARRRRARLDSRRGQRLAGERCPDEREGADPCKEARLAHEIP